MFWRSSIFRCVRMITDKRKYRTTLWIAMGPDNINIWRGVAFDKFKQFFFSLFQLSRNNVIFATAFCDYSATCFFTISGCDGYRDLMITETRPVTLHTSYVQRYQFISSLNYITDRPTWEFMVELRTPIHPPPLVYNQHSGGLSSSMTVLTALLCTSLNKRKLSK